MNEFVLNLSGARLRRADLSNTNLTRANFSRADFSCANFRGANFKDANLEGTILIGADLSDTSNLTWLQLNKAVIDETTIPPKSLTDQRVPAE